MIAFTPSHNDMLSWLIEHGYLIEVEHAYPRRQHAFTVKSLSLISGRSEHTIRPKVDFTDDGLLFTTLDLQNDLIAGLNRLYARHNNRDLLDILYEEATRKELNNNQWRTSSETSRTKTTDDASTGIQPARPVEDGEPVG